MWSKAWSSGVGLVHMGEQFLQRKEKLKFSEIIANIICKHLDVLLIFICSDCVPGQYFGSTKGSKFDVGWQIFVKDRLENCKTHYAIWLTNVIESYCKCIGAREKATEGQGGISSDVFYPNPKGKGGLLIRSFNLESGNKHRLTNRPKSVYKYKIGNCW